MEISTTSSYGNTALGAYISIYDKEISKSLERLSSGLRISSPSDDPGSYFRSQTLHRQANRSTAVSKQLEDHLSRINSAEKYLGTVSGILDDMVGIAKEAQDETNETLRVELGKEYDVKLSALEEFVTSSRYDGERFLTGTYDVSAGGSAIRAQIDEEIDDIYEYEILDTSTASATGLNLGAADDAETEWTDARGGTAQASSFVAALEDGDSGLTRINRNLNRIGTHKTIIEGAQRSLDNKSANYQAASSALVGVDDAAESTRLSAMQIRQQAAASFLAQSNAINNGVIGMLTGVNLRT
jgi:flagellin